MSKEKAMIRNSTAEFLIFTMQSGADSIEVRVADETVWLTQKMMSELFAVEANTINYHLQEIFKTKEVLEEATTRIFRVVQSEGVRQVERNMKFFNLDAIISVGYRVNSLRATQFRQWATGVLRDFAVRGYVLDKERLKNGSLLGKEYRFRSVVRESGRCRVSVATFRQTHSCSVLVHLNQNTALDF